MFIFETFIPFVAEDEGTGLALSALVSTDLLIYSRLLGPRCEGAIKEP